ncbi:MAG: LCP family protein, partial [Clostridia bacterium]
ATLQNNFGVRVDRTMAVNFSLMADLIDQIGGVDVEVTEQERTQLNSILRFYNKKSGVAQEDGLLSSAGEQHLNGKQALSFSRIRKIDSDFQRTSRQHRVLLGILKQLTHMDFVSLAALAATNMNKVTTDLRLEDINALLPIVMNAANLRLRSTHVPFDGTYEDQTINGMMVLVPNLSRNKKLIGEFLTQE